MFYGTQLLHNNFKIRLQIGILKLSKHFVSCNLCRLYWTQRLKGTFQLTLAQIYINVVLQLKTHTRYVFSRTSLSLFGLYLLYQQKFKKLQLISGRSCLIPYREQVMLVSIVLCFCHLVCLGFLGQVTTQIPAF